MSVLKDILIEKMRALFSGKGLHRFLKNHESDFEDLTAGNQKQKILSSDVVAFEGNLDISA